MFIYAILIYLCACTLNEQLNHFRCAYSIGPCNSSAANDRDKKNEKRYQIDLISERSFLIYRWDLHFKDYVPTTFSEIASQKLMYKQMLSTVSVRSSIRIHAIYKQNVYNYIIRTLIYTNIFQLILLSFTNLIATNELLKYPLFTSHKF